MDLNSILPPADEETTRVVVFNIPTKTIMAHIFGKAASVKFADLETLNKQAMNEQAPSSPPQQIHVS